MEKLRHMKKILAGSSLAVIALFLMLLIVILGVLGAVTGGVASTTGTGTGISQGLSADVLRYRELVTDLAAKYDMSDYVPLVLAVMQQESGGQGLDPMQSSEGAYNTRYLPRRPNSITDPAYSIECGVQELKEALRLAECTGPTDLAHIKLALQAYNYGPGFISWAKSHGGYSEANAVQYSNMMATKEGWSSYGDPQYVEHVLQYYGATGGGAGYDDATFQTLQKTGEGLLGTPYVLGGDTPGVAMDCSSFVCYVYTKSGIKNMPRTTAQGIYDQYCTPISPTEAKAGDIIFFRGTYDCPDVISHVAIYCGNGVMLEEGGKQVQYANSTSPYWTSHFYGYGRVKS